MASKTTSQQHKHRLQLFQAHQTLHEARNSRRRVDQWIAGGIMVVAIALSAVGYWAWTVWGA